MDRVNDLNIKIEAKEKGLVYVETKIQDAETSLAVIRDRLG